MIESMRPMYFLLQSLIIFAVVASNIAYQWTPNRILPGLLGVGMAVLLTACWNGLSKQRLSRTHSEQELGLSGQTIDDQGRKAGSNLLSKG